MTEQQDRGPVVAVVEVEEHRDRWPFEEWRCALGDEAHTPQGGWLGIVLQEDCDGNERARAIAPWLVLFESGAALMVCEDCAYAMEQEAVAAVQASYDERGPW